MLILARRCRETIYIGDDIKVTVLGVQGGVVRIGISAPKDVLVFREEVYKRIQEGQARSDGSAAADTEPQSDK